MPDMILLGAGASYDAGVPMAYKMSLAITGEFRKFADLYPGRYSDEIYKFAHDINLHITQADILGVYNVLTPEEKEVAKGFSLPSELDRLVTHVACVLSVHFVAKSIEARSSV